jgi:hypothetical protein
MPKPEPMAALTGTGNHEIAHSSDSPIHVGQ